MFAVSPLAFTYALRVVRSVVFGEATILRKGTAAVALGLAALNAAWSLMYLALELFVPIDG